MEEKMVDRYTKVVLTIIAACLAVIATKEGGYGPKWPGPCISR
jgi:hypothetical protein